jgi:alkylated DNA nucleotide flippase Atl1
MSTSFPPSSRYHLVAELTKTLPDGTVVTYLARRVLPAVERFVPLEMRRLDGTERPDTLAADAYGDPLLWWRIIDASGEEDPADLTGTEGRLIVVPLPLELTD